MYRGRPLGWAWEYRLKELHLAIVQSEDFCLGRIMGK